MGVAWGDGNAPNPTHFQALLALQQDPEGAVFCRKGWGLTLLTKFPERRASSGKTCLWNLGNPHLILAERSRSDGPQEIHKGRKAFTVSVQSNSTQLNSTDSANYLTCTVRKLEIPQ